jgi:hypothetical protein
LYAFCLITIVFMFAHKGYSTEWKLNMNKNRLSIAIAATLTLGISGCDQSKNDNTPAAVVPANILLSNNRLAFIDLNSPGTSLTTPSAITTGILTGDTLVSIDRRPQNGFLYGLGYNATAGTVTLYTIHPETSVATRLGVAGGFVGADGTTPVMIGGGNANTRFEIDFNPAVDRVRVISSLGENFRMDPNTGAVVDGNLGISPAPALTNMDGSLNIVTGSTSIPAQAQGTAYTNNVANNGAVTTQYTLDETTNSLYIQNPPNMGSLSSAKLLSPTVASILGFDIAPGVNAAASSSPVTSGSGFALVKTGASSAESLATVDLVTGVLSNITAITGGTGAIGLAVQQPASAAVIALSGNGTSLLRFAANTPGATTSVAITGITLGESLVGIDFRPATGQLYALGINPAMDNGTLYRIDPQTGAANVIGTAGSIKYVGADGITAVDLPDPATVGYGFDFNPTVDRIRVTTGSVSGSGLNLRMHPDTGAPVDGNLGSMTASSGVNPDGAINGAVTGVDGSAYTNSVAGATVTTLYNLSSVTSQLTIQSPPNNGTQTSATKLRVGGADLVFTAVNGFDIPSDVRVTTSDMPVTSGFGFAALKVGGVRQLYRINLVSGAAENLGTIGASDDLRGLAVGQTHAK